jgi:hypothetical protein
MQTRYKILILLFTITLALGALTLPQFTNNNDAIRHFRAFFSDRTLYNLKPTLASITASASLWYGALSLFAILMIVLVFWSARRRGAQRHSERFTATRAAKVHSGKSQATEPASVKAAFDSVMPADLKLMTDLLQEKNATITELEKSLSGKQQLLQSRSKELDELKSKMHALTEQIADFRLAKERAENSLQQELKKTKLLQAKDSVIAGLENHLAETQKLLQERSQEVDAFKSQMNALTEQLTDLKLAKERAEIVLQRELDKTKVLQEKNPVIAEQEEGLRGQVHALEHALNEKQGLLQAKKRELKAAKSKVNTLRQRLSALGTTKKQTEDVLQQQLKQKSELLQIKDAAIKQLQESLSAKVGALEARVDAKQRLSEDRKRNSEVFASEGSNLTESDSSKNRAQSLLLQELQTRAEILEAKDAALKQLEQQLNSTVLALENARSELERVAQEREAALVCGLPKNGPAKERTENVPLRSDRRGMNSKLLELGAAKARAAGSLQSEEAKRALEANDQNILLTNKSNVLKTEEGFREEPTRKGANEEKT